MDAHVAKRRCEGTTKAGAPCKSTPLLPGTVISGVTVSGRWCYTHDEDIPAEAMPHMLRTPEQMQGRPKLPRAIDIQRELIERNFLVAITPSLRTIGYEPVIEDGEPVLKALPGGGAKLHGVSKDGEVVLSEHEDLKAKREAEQSILDRVYGKPKQSVEATVEAHNLNVGFDAGDPETRAVIADLLRRRPASQ